MTSGLKRYKMLEAGEVLAFLCQRGYRDRIWKMELDMGTVKDFTKGSPAKGIMLFALPLMLGNLFQQLYTMVDTIIVGQGVGVNALASLGAADWLSWMVLGLMTGLTQGFGILFSQFYGAGDIVKLKKSIGDACIVVIAALVLLTTAAELAIEPVLRVLNTPADVYGGAVLYLRILFAGIPVSLLYNFASAMLRSLGDGKSPLYAMVCASCVNIGLDSLFVLGLKWGIAGAAVATIIAQGVSLLYCVRVIRGISVLHIQREDLHPDKRMIVKLLGLGLPIMFQNTIISVGGMVVQYVINGFGVLFVAGFTATNKLYGILEVAAISYGFSVTTYVAQNYGAGDYGRIRKGIRAGIGLALATSCVISAFMFLCGRMILSMFISAPEPEGGTVLGIAWHYLQIMSVFLMVLYLLYVYRAALQGLGNTLVPMVSGFVELIMRVAAVMILPRFFGEEGLFWAEVMAWAGAAAILAVAYYVEMKRKEP